ncbi:hypothetical protein U9M48_030100 [Paspalum notatum var. saurae]|uniref:KIB1-4 beta-propeller domain-containing protein n=1 Tax=Paspalum notatum var. saurae TaxID=547442 RepID=A0AAQ3U064_PASNO
MPPPLSGREIAISKRRPNNKLCHGATSASTSGWADLLDCLLHHIMSLLSSFPDLLAFTGTCRSWRAALASFPSTWSFSIPPLHLQSHGRYPLRTRMHTRYSHRKNRRHVTYSLCPKIDVREYSLLYNCEWQLTDPVQGSSRHCSPPQNIACPSMNYLDSSYGHLIFSNSTHSLLVDVFSGATVRPPRFEPVAKGEIVHGILDAPINSPNSHLFLLSASSIFQWKVGSNSWVEHCLIVERILQIVFFKGEMYAVDDGHGIHIIRLAPQPSIHEVKLDLKEYLGEDIMCDLSNWLMVCGGMLLFVNLYTMPDDFATFRVFRLDVSIEPAKCVKVENMGNHAIFLSCDLTNPVFSCTNPERWGGKSNCFYIATHPEDSNKPWTVFELGQTVPLSTWWCIRHPDHDGKRPDDLWVLPSLVYDVGREVAVAERPSLKPFHALSSTSSSSSSSSSASGPDV